MSATLNSPQDIVTDGIGAIFIADTGNHRVRRIDPLTGFMSTVAGDGLTVTGSLSITAAATSLSLNNPSGLAIDSSGNLYISDSGHHAIRMVTQGGNMSTVAGNGSPGFGGTGLSESATAASLNQPAGLAVDAQGGLLIADQGNHAIRKLSAGILSTLAGQGSAGYSGLTQTATLAFLTSPSKVAVDGSGSIYFSEPTLGVIRKIQNGVLSTVVGVGSTGFGGDGGPADSAQLDGAEGLLIDAHGDILIADGNNARIRRVNSCGVSPYTRPALPACVLGGALSSARGGGIKDVARDYLRFRGLVAPNPVMAGGGLCVHYPSALRSATVLVYDLSGTLIAQGGSVADRSVCLAAPTAPGVYFVRVQADSIDGDSQAQVLKFAVVRP
jgi:sugar lactone lactonase YvrE